MREGCMLELISGFAGVCRFFNIEPADALQFFVSNVTLRGHLARECEAIGATANKVINHYLQQKKGKNKLEKSYKSILKLEYVQEIMQLLKNHGGSQKKFQLYARVVEKWYTEIQERLTPETILISKGKRLFLTADFRILCDLMQCNCVKVIQHYINHVSLEKYFYSRDEDIYATATSFFLQYPPVRWRAKVV